MSFKFGDKVRIREDATTEGEPFGEFFLEHEWKVVAVNGELIELSTRVEETDVKLHTFAYKVRHAEEAS